MRSTLLRDVSPDIRTFKSKGIIISPISNQNSVDQIIDIIRQVTLVLQLRVTWRDLPSEWLTSENALFVNDKYVSIYVPLREEVTAASDGDGIHDFHQSPCNVGSPGSRLLPRCITLSGMKIPSLSSGRATDLGISFFVQFLPLHWELDHLTEALIFRNFPFDTHGELTRLLLHYVDEFLSNKLQNANIALQYSLVIAPVLVQQTRLEAVGVVLLPPLRPGINLTLLQRLHSLVGIKDALPVLLSLGWTSLLMGTTRAEVLNPLHLTQLPPAPPLVMSITGLERGLSLCDILTAAWEDSNYFPQFFEHLAAAFVQRSAIYSAKPSFFVEGALRSHGGADSLHLILDSPTSGPTAIRPTVGRELRTLLGTTQEGLYATPDVAQLSPHPIGLYVKLISSHRAVQSKPPARSVLGGRGRTGRSRGASRSAAGTPEARTSKPLLMVDADILQRYQEMVRGTPLMTAAIPPGQRHNESLNVPHSWTPFSELSGRLLLMILRKAWERMRKRVTSSMICETGLLAGGVLDMDCLILLLHISVNHWSLVRHDLLLLLPPSGPASHTQTRPTTGIEAECDRLDYQSC